MKRSKMIQPDFTISDRAMGYDCENDTITARRRKPESLLLNDGRRRAVYIDR